jgi:hypothetical protein
LSHERLLSARYFLDFDPLAVLANADLDDETEGELLATDPVQPIYDFKITRGLLQNAVTLAEGLQVHVHASISNWLKNATPIATRNNPDSSLPMSTPLRSMVQTPAKQTIAAISPGLSDSTPRARKSRSIPQSAFVEIPGKYFFSHWSSYS